MSATAAPVNAHTAVSGGIPKGEGRILNAVASYLNGCTREQISVLTSYKRSTRNTYIKRLMAGGMVALLSFEGRERVMATDAGREKLGPSFVPLPTGEALREHWLATLPAGEACILQILIDRYPESVPRERISEETGYKRSTRNTYLKRLKTRELIEVTSGGDPAASENLF